MGINAMENQVYDPQAVSNNDSSVWGKIMMGAAAVLLVAVLAYGIKWALDIYYGPAIAIVGQVTATDEGKGYGKYCYNGKCEQVKLCTGVSDECGSMVQGPPADYGTGFHTSADGRVRPNPPAGWKWAGQ